MLAVIVFLWVSTSIIQLTSGFAGAIGASARLLGLLATYAALTQLLLMGRIWWIERPFGVDVLARFHRVNGYAALIFLSIHAMLIIFSRSLQSGQNYIAEYLQTIETTPAVLLAIFAEILFFTVVVSSIYIVRKRLKFESWYFVHLLAYLAIVLMSFHQFKIGTTIASTEFATLFWYSLYGFVAVNVLLWRFSLPTYRMLTNNYRVVKVKQETPSVTSIYIKGSKVTPDTVKPGQFILVRIFAKKLWWQEHPFTVSWIPRDNMLRISVRDVGDYTHDIQSLKPAARVLIGGPLGRFTSEKAMTRKRLFIAGGVGITPLRAMLEEAAIYRLDSTLFYANRNSDDVPLKHELEAISKRGKQKHVYVYSDDKKASGEHGRVDKEFIKKHAPDVTKRDVYICGPPQMMAATEEALLKLGVPAEQIHSEKFALHP